MGVCMCRMTIGLEYGCKALSVRDQDVNIEMWDTVRAVPQQGDCVARGLAKWSVRVSVCGTGGAREL